MTRIRAVLFAMRTFWGAFVILFAVLFCIGVFLTLLTSFAPWWGAADWWRGGLGLALLGVTWLVWTQTEG